jgi:hypothetical protein
VKQRIAAVLVLLLVAGVSFAGFWIGRTGVPMAQPKSETASVPTVVQSSSSASNPQPGTVAADTERATPKRVQSTYVPQAASSQPDSAATSAQHQSTQPKSPQKPAADIIAALETDDHKSAFANPSIAPHQAVMSETPDPDWSQAAAQQLRDYLAAQLGNRFEYPLVQCGQDICEIQAATMLGSDSHADVRDFQLSDENMRLQPWWLTLQFDELTFQVDSVDDGRDVMIVFITRK